MKLPLAPQAETALGILQGAGYEAWIVGGCVRDLLLGRLRAIESWKRASGMAP